MAITKFEELIAPHTPFTAFLVPNPFKSLFTVQFSSSFSLPYFWNFSAELFHKQFQSTAFINPIAYHLLQSMTTARSIILGSIFWLWSGNKSAINQQLLRNPVGIACKQLKIKTAFDSTIISIKIIIFFIQFIHTISNNNASIL